MQFPANFPGTADIVEKRIVYDYYNLKKAIYSNPPSNTNIYQLVENQGTFPMPTLAERIVWTPGDEALLVIPSMYWIASIALPIMPNHGADGGAIWNYIKPVTP